MQVYGHRSFALDLREFRQRMVSRLECAARVPPHDEVVEWLVDFAEAESGLADALCPDLDDEVPDLGAWRDALHLLADAFCASMTRDPALVSTLDRFRRSATALPLIEPSTVQARVAEGFACYALYPEQYVDAARQFASAERTGAIVCIGIRSIGSVLAAVFAAALRRAGRQSDTRTVRPRGHPFDRQVKLGPGLEQFLASRGGASFVIIDEGPGISGSSFAAVADTLARLGIPYDRITLVPSWRCDPRQLRSSRARDLFLRCRILVGEPTAALKAKTAIGGDAVRDLSAGQWRTQLLPAGSSWPAVQPQHERVKYLQTGEAEAPMLARFAGLGRHGRTKLTRALALHEGGFGPCPRHFSDGFLVREWIEGQPLPLEEVSIVSVQRAADYLAFTSKTFALDEPDDGDDLADMLRHNASEGLGVECLPAVQHLIANRVAADRPRVAVDGRMSAHEWIVRTDPRAPLLKVDALDHHADDFLPGCRDIAWDVAGACVELQLSAAARETLVSRYVQVTGDRHVLRRLPFFMAAYLAYRLGYSSLAADALGRSPDGIRFTKARERYRRLLAAHVGLRRPAAVR